MQKMMSHMRSAMEKYNMITAGDRVAVGLSGGKDSTAMLVALANIRRFYPEPFELVAISLDPCFGGEETDFSPLEKLCEEIGVEYIIKRTELGKIIFETRNEKNPCSLCAKMRRGALHAAAKEMGCNKVALGHHFDDAVETFMLNLFFEGRLGSFSPVTYLSVRDITLIRPMIYAQEKDVEYVARHLDLPLVVSTCPEDHATERENMKRLLRDLESKNKGLRHRIFGALCRSGIDGYKATDKLPREGS